MVREVSGLWADVGGLPLPLFSSQAAGEALQNGIAKVELLKAALQEDTLKSLEAKKQALAAVAGGNFEGKSWKAELQANSPMSAVSKAAKSMLKKDVAQALTKSFTELTEEYGGHIVRMENPQLLLKPHVVQHAVCRCEQNSSLKKKGNAWWHSVGGGLLDSESVARCFFVRSSRRPSRQRSCLPCSRWISSRTTLSQLMLPPRLQRRTYSPVCLTRRSPSQRSRVISRVRSPGSAGFCNVGSAARLF